MLSASRSFLLTLLIAVNSLLVATPTLASDVMSPTNSNSMDGQTVMLKGHDVVSYFTRGTHALGSSSFSSTYKGVTFRFASAEHKALFDKEPEKYIPQFGGYCTNGIVYSIPWGGDADAWQIIDGKLYIFGGQSSKNYFLMDQANNMALANKYWAEEIQGRNAFIQRYKRLVFKVPHYKTGAQLEKEYQERQTKK